MKDMMSNLLVLFSLISQCTYPLKRYASRGGTIVSKLKDGVAIVRTCCIESFLGNVVTRWCISLMSNPTSMQVFGGFQVWISPKLEEKESVE